MASNEIELLGDISEIEKSSIPETVVQAISVKWADKQREVDDLVSELTKSKVNADEVKFSFEKELATLRELLEREGKLKAEAERKNEQNTSNLEASAKELNQANERINDLLTQFEMCQTEQENASASDPPPTGSLETKERLIKELKQQIQTVETQLVTCQSEKYKALIQAEDFHTQKIQYEYKERRLEQEKTLMAKQLDLVRKQLEERADEALRLRGQHSTKLLSLQTDLTKATEEVCILREEKDAADKVVSEKSSTIEKLLKSLNESREAQNKLEMTFKQELVAQEKLANSYKDSSDDQRRRCEEMDAEMAELKQLIQSVTEQYGVLEKEKLAAEEELQDQLSKQAEIIENLRKQTNSSFLPTDGSTTSATAAGDLCAKGIGLSQLYSDYMATKDQLLDAQHENKRLGRYVDQILKEIENKAPLLNKQKDDYIHALETIESLRHQLDQNIVHMELHQQDTETLRGKTSVLTRENVSLNKQVKDLSKQVTILLTEVEAARLGQESLPQPGTETGGNLTGEDIVSSHLVTFKSVAEMQQQNIKLLASIRELSEKVDNADSEAVANSHSELKKELDVLRRKLEDSKASEGRLQNLLESVSKQRDLYKTLSHEQNAKDEPVDDKSPAPVSKRVQELQAQLTSTEKQLEKVKSDYDEYRKERSTNQKIEQDLADKYRQELQVVRSENVCLQSKMEYKEQQLKTVTSNSESFQRQLQGLQTNTRTMQEIIGRHEGTIETLRSQTMKLSKDLSKAEVAAFNLKEEKALLKESEARLLAEIESLRKSSVSQDLILSNLQLINNNLERTDVESRMTLENQVKKLNQECASLRLKIESNMELKQANAKLSTTEQLLETKKSEMEELQKILDQSQSELKETQAKLAEAESASHAQSGEEASQQHILNLETKWKAEQVKSKELQSKLDAMSDKCEELKASCAQQEKQIVQSAQTSKIAEDTLSRLRKDKTELEKQKTNLTTELLKLKMLIDGTQDVSIDQLAKMKEDLAEKDSRLNAMTQELKAAQLEKEESLSRLQEQEKLASLAQQKYEQEVVLHGSDLQALSALKEHHSNHDQDLHSLKMAEERARESLKTVEAACAAKELEIQKTKMALNERIEDLEKQNHDLLEQFTQLSDKMAAVQAKLASSGEGSVAITEEEARTTSQLQEVIKYLRKEKELSVHKLEVSLAESQRLEAQRVTLETHVDQLNNELQETKQNNSSSLESMGRYGELMRKVHTLDALADSNRLLREEKDKLLSSMEEMKKKAVSFESQIVPLQQRLAEVTKNLESIKIEKDAIMNEKETYRKRTADLIEKLNKNNPEDFAKLQQQLTSLENQVKSKDSDLTRTKSLNQHLQKAQQQLMANKNQIQTQLTTLREEAKKSTEEVKKVSLEKAKFQQQLFQALEKVKTLMAQSNSNQTSQQAEINKVQEQVTELQKREELLKKETETLRRDKLIAEKKFKEMSDKVESLEKQGLQLRRIAKKYKEKAEGTSSEGDVDMGASAERVKEMEDKIATLEQQLTDSQAAQQSATSAGTSSQEQMSGEQKSEIVGVVKTEYESRISSLEQENEELTRKLKQMETIKKQIPLVSKSVAGPLAPEKTNDPPPTANIKPMAAPAAVSRAPQTASQSVPGSSKSIPTASIRPMTPSATVGVVLPRETEGTISSTMALPTVTPSVAQSFQPTLTATVSPTPVSTSVVEGAPIAGPSALIVDSQDHVPAVDANEDSSEGAANPMDCILSQAFAMVNPQELDSSPSNDMVAQPSGSGKRKLEPTVEDSPVKRSRVEQDDAQPSSSTRGPKTDDDDLIVIEDSESNDRPQDIEEEEEGEESSNSPGIQLFLSNIEEREAQTQQGPEPSNQAAEEEPANEPRPSFSLFGRTPASQEQPSSTRPSFVPFQGGFNEATDDRIVPSTPTLLLQKPFEGISSLQVAPDDVFSAGVSQSSQQGTSSQGGLSQEINTGHIDATRMDLGQIEVSGQRSLLSQVSHTGEPSSDDNITSSGGDGFKEDSNQSGGVPSCSFAEPSQGSEADSVGAPVEDDTSEAQQQPSQISNEPKAVRPESSPRPAGVPSPGPSTSPQAPRRITPITWEESEESNSAGRGRATAGRMTTRSTTRGQRAKRSRPPFRGR